MNFLAGTRGVWETLEYLSRYSWGMPLTGMMTDWSRTGLVVSVLVTTPFVPNGVGHGISCVLHLLRYLVLKMAEVQQEE